MSQYAELVKALRHCYEDDDACATCQRWLAHDEWGIKCKGRLISDAAAAIEALQANVKRLKEDIDELREAQTYIDHYGDKWLTSAKDVPTSAYQHGYADGWHEAMAKMEVQE